MTNPSLFKSNGLHAEFISEFFVNAFIFVNPAIDIGEIPDSDPPATIASASPYFIIL